MATMNFTLPGLFAIGLGAKIDKLLAGVVLFLALGSWLAVSLL